MASLTPALSCIAYVGEGAFYVVFSGMLDLLRAASLSCSVEAARNGEFEFRWTDVTDLGTDEFAA